VAEAPARTDQGQNCHKFKNLVNLVVHQLEVIPGRREGMKIAIEPRTALRGGYPLILTLDTHGVPHRWISWQHACYYYAKDQVAWTTGAHAFTVFGGMSRLTGLRSSITASSIIAIKGKAMAMKAFGQVPPLNNRELFHRDRQVCAYCSSMFPISRLTRDHVTPFSRGGRDSWMNTVTACRACNERKGNCTPEQAGMELVYLPYVPNRAEYLILTNRRILTDQMEFLAQHVPAQSRLRQGLI